MEKRYEKNKWVGEGEAEGMGACYVIISEGLSENI